MTSGGNEAHFDRSRAGHLHDRSSTTNASDAFYGASCDASCVPSLSALPTSLSGVSYAYRRRWSSHCEVEKMKREESQTLEVDFGRSKGLNSGPIVIESASRSATDGRLTCLDRPNVTTSRHGWTDGALWFCIRTLRPTIRWPTRCPGPVDKRPDRGTSQWII